MTRFYAYGTSVQPLITLTFNLAQLHAYCTTTYLKNAETLTV